MKTLSVLFYAGIVGVRYVLIFKLKNPLAIDDDFWNRFDESPFRPPKKFPGKSLSIIYGQKQFDECAHQ
jgi:hypothetical protein